MSFRWIGIVVVAACGSRGEPPAASSAEDTAGASEVTDALSMPAAPTLDVGSLHRAEACASCHPDHYAEWKVSNHAYAMIDPVFRALTRVRQRDLGGTEDRFCTQCHSTLGTRSGDIVAGYTFDNLSPLTLEGVTCEACHRISDVPRAFNAGHVLDPGGPMRATLADPTPSTFHASTFDEGFGESKFCGSCHDVVETNGLDLERPYEEWLASPAAATGQSCQSCHMPERTGPAAVGGPNRTLHRHRWVGVDVPLSEGFATDAEIAMLADEVRALLQSAATLNVSSEAAAPGGTTAVRVTVTNDIPAHDFPTGSTFLRQAWVELTAVDGAGTTLFQTGHLDAQGDLRDVWSELDPYGDGDLMAFHSGFLDTQGTPTLWTHDAVEHISRSLSPLHSRTHTVFVTVPSDAVSPVTVSARLRFRAFPPYLLRALDLGDLTERLIVTDIDTDEVVLAWP